MRHTGPQSRIDPGVRIAWNTKVHPDLRAAFKARAAYQGVSMEELLHRILCGELDRLDLIERTPEAARA
jgi:hypothetical protein